MPFNTNCPGCGSLGPCGCSGEQCKFVSSENVKYIGPNLAGTGIQSCDDLTVVLQKIDNAIAIIEAQISPTPPTTTTSSTSARPTTSTTSTTTTGPAFYTWYLGGLVNLSSPCTSAVLLPPLYTSVPVLANGVVLYTNSARTIPYSGYIYITNLSTKWTVSSGGALSAATSC
jgi:hypothetical protein